MVRFTSCKYSIIRGSLASKLPSTWLTTSRESKYTSTSHAPRSRIAFIPVSKASYSASLLDVLKPYLKECSTHIPFDVIITIPAPAPTALDASSTNTFQGLTSTQHTVPTSLLNENYTTKSARTWPLTKLLGLYFISNDSCLIPHLAILPVKSDLFNKDCNGYSVSM